MKNMIGFHCNLLRDFAFPQIRRMPLFAYLPARSAKDCLLIISDHCRRVKDLCYRHHKDATPRGLWGGLQISLDLEKAFDVVSQDHIMRILQVFDIFPHLQIPDNLLAPAP